MCRIQTSCCSGTQRPGSLERTANQNFPKGPHGRGRGVVRTLPHALSGEAHQALGLGTVSGDGTCRLLTQKAWQRVMPVPSALCPVTTRPWTQGAHLQAPPPRPTWQAGSISSKFHDRRARQNVS